MLRIVVAILLGINVLYAAHQWGWLAAIGVGSAPTSEARTPSGEVAPERIVIVAPAASDDTTNTAADATPLAEAQLPVDIPSVARVCRAVDALPPDLHAQAVQALEGVLKDSARWTSTESLVNGRWIVYIGRLTDTQLQSRRAQLRAANIDHRLVTTPRLSPGLALGTYSSPERARNALDIARGQGVRDARVEQERAPTRAFSLQINGLTPDELAAVQALEAFKGNALQPCP